MPRAPSLSRKIPLSLERMHSPELHLGPPQDRNRLFPKLLIAAALMITIGAIVYRLNPRKTPEINIRKVRIFAPHTVMNPPIRAIHILGAPPESEDDVYALTTFAITNTLSHPVFVESVSSTIIASDGTTLQATIIAPSDLPRLEAIFPQILSLLEPPQPPPLAFQETINPGATRVAAALLLFPRTSLQAWQTKKSATLSVSLLHQTAPISTNFR